MSNTTKSKSHSRHKAGVLFLVGVLAGVTIGGGAGVIAASSTKFVTVCANKKTNVLRYAKNGKCVKQRETKVTLNQTGATGAAGNSGATGAKGDTGAAGNSGATGAKGDTGAAGSSFTARSVCGADGQTLCAVGVQGPGGGTVFFVDAEGRYSDFDYLEVSPTDASNGVAWSTTTPQCGPITPLTSCRTTFVTTSGEALNFLAIGTGQAATAAIVARHTAGGVAKTDYAAGVADDYTTSTASDWFLPSQDELNALCKWAFNDSTNMVCNNDGSGSLTKTNGNFPSVGYWSSSEFSGWSIAAYFQAFNVGFEGWNNKQNNPYHVRPVRAF